MLSISLYCSNLLQESLADAKVSARQQCVYMKASSEEIYSKSTICDFLFPFARYFRAQRLKIVIFAHCILIVDS